MPSPPLAIAPSLLQAPSMPAAAHPDAGAEHRTWTTVPWLLWQALPLLPTVVAAVPPPTAEQAEGPHPVPAVVSTLPCPQSAAPGIGAPPLLLSGPILLLSPQLSLSHLSLLAVAAPTCCTWPAQESICVCVVCLSPVLYVEVESLELL